MATSVSVGVAGHVHHGKTSLVKCLTRIDTDRLREEKERGLSIQSGIFLTPSLCIKFISNVQKLRQSRLGGN